MSGSVILILIVMFLGANLTRASVCVAIWLRKCRKRAARTTYLPTGFLLAVCYADVSVDIAVPDNTEQKTNVRQID